MVCRQNLLGVLERFSRFFCKSLIDNAPKPIGGFWRNGRLFLRKSLSSNAPKPVGGFGVYDKIFKSLIGNDLALYACATRNFKYQNSA